ncbi:oligosaccharide flippase family protein [Leptolyngbya cf. ectocarpi LEGE 11479]|uniref:Oligosaccharide flippase family protein n=1 Tax=Leptolyngbya cf. ectocarpi LEGE 11479 TaxID=1828722 RepID=A0A928ZYG2_LEPEC|nr:oligosaccharide flippase family protein [Leptolyngbya ectocarpi]MBE9069693.1 oligosaccharide flippase family protein [Leptolyngbya cf. ectocarpi LEGE 11479]
MNKIISKVKKIFSGSLVKDSFWMLSSQILGIFIQGAYFIIVARVLGAGAYGIFIGIASFVKLVVPFVGLGNADIFLKHVSRDQRLFRGYWGTTLLTCLIFNLGLIPLMLGLSRLVFNPGTSLLLILFVLLADLLGGKIWDLAAGAFVACDQFKLVAQSKILYGLGKLIAAIGLLVFFEDGNVVAWGGLYCLGSIFPALSSVLTVNKLFGNPIFNLKKYPPEFAEGFFFAIAQSAETVNGQIDRTMLVSLASADAAGIYAAGYRFIDVGYIIIIAVMSATYTRFLRHGASGIKAGLKFALKLVPVSVGYGIISAIALVSLAPFTANILGEEYAQSGGVLLWLAPIHLIATLQFIAADTLTGSGFHRVRSILQVTAAFINFGANLYLIPRFSWQGAAWATLTSETFKLITLWLAVLFYSKRATIQGQLANAGTDPELD